MKARITDIYKGWTISVTAADNQCSSFSFEVKSPTGVKQHVSLGGITEQRALERAREMIELEIALLPDDDA